MQEACFCGRSGDIRDRKPILDSDVRIRKLPDAKGKPACECGHPEMRRLPDGVYRCPSCASEVVYPKQRHKNLESPG